MKSQDYTTAVDSVSDGVETTQFNISGDSAMFRMLTSNVYNNPIKAVIREWSTNACDACIAAGKEIKFEVHLPTVEDPTFHVRDYGTGLHPDSISGVFCSLGASTKRDSDAYNGQMGIGRMAGLAVADAFTVESFYEGTHYTFVVSLENGIPVLLSMGEMPTTEPNGLRLSVSAAVDDIYTYNQEAEDVYKHFTHKPAINKELDLEYKNFKRLSENCFQADNIGSYKSSSVVMSQVAYEIPRSGVVDFQGFSDIALETPPGAVTFNPGRESLSLDNKTVEYLNERFENLYDTYLSNVTAKLALAENDADLITFYLGAKGAAPWELMRQIDLSTLFSPEVAALTGNRAGNGYLPNVYCDHHFNSASSGLLQLTYKSSYNKVGKRITDDNSVGLQSFMSATHVIVDVKTRFKPVLDAKYNDKSVVQWRQMTTSVDLDAATAMAEKILTAIGLPFVRVSDLMKSVEVPYTDTKKQSRQEGLYARKLVIGSMDFGVSKLIKPSATEEEALYLPLNKTTPDLGDTSRPFAAYVRAIQLLARAGVEVPPIYGVPKKYQPLAKQLDNWSDFETYVQEKMADKVFRKPLALEIELSHQYLHENSYTSYPTDVQDLYLEIQSYKEFIRADNGLRGQEEVDIAEAFKAQFEHYSPSREIDLGCLEDKYPEGFKALITPQVSYRLPVAPKLMPYFLELEAANALRKTSE